MFSAGVEKVLKRLIRKEIKNLPNPVKLNMPESKGESPSEGGGSTIRPGTASLSG